MSIIDDIRKEFNATEANGFFPIYGFKGMVGYAGESIGTICPYEVSQYGCKIFYDKPLINNNKTILEMSMVYGIRLSFTEYLEANKILALANFGSKYKMKHTDLSVKLHSADLFYDVCSKTNNTIDLHPEIYFVCKKSIFLDYFVREHENMDFEPNFRDNNKIHIFGNCNRCNEMEFIYNDYHSSIDLGIRYVKKNEILKQGRLPAAIHPF